MLVTCRVPATRRRSAFTTGDSGCVKRSHENRGCERAPTRCYSTSYRQLFWYTLDCKAVATRQIPDMYKPKPNPYLNANPNANPNPTKPTSILSKFSGKRYLVYSLKSTNKILYVRRVVVSYTIGTVGAGMQLPLYPRSASSCSYHIFPLCQLTTLTIHNSLSLFHSRLKT